MSNTHGFARDFLSPGGGHPLWCFLPGCGTKFVSANDFETVSCQDSSPRQNSFNIMCSSLFSWLYTHTYIYIRIYTHTYIYNSQLNENFDSFCIVKPSHIPIESPFFMVKSHESQSNHIFFWLSPTKSR